MGKYHQTGQQTALQTASNSLVLYYRILQNGWTELGVYGMVFLLKGRAISIQKIKTIIHFITVLHHLGMGQVTVFQDNVM